MPPRAPADAAIRCFALFTRSCRSGAVARWKGARRGNYLVLPTTPVICIVDLPLQFGKLYEPLSSRSRARAVLIRLGATIERLGNGFP